MGNGNVGAGLCLARGRVVRAGGNCPLGDPRPFCGPQTKGGQAWGHGGRAIGSTRVQAPGFPSLNGVVVGKRLNFHELPQPSLRNGLGQPRPLGWCEDERNGCLTRASGQRCANASAGAFVVGLRPPGAEPTGHRGPLPFSSWPLWARGVESWQPRNRAGVTGRRPRTPCPQRATQPARAQMMAALRAPSGTTP